MLDDADNPEDLRIEAAAQQDVWVVVVEGELDASSAARLRSAVEEGLNEGLSSVVLDLAGISFIDSSGLSALIHAYKEVEDREGALTLRAPSASVIRVLEMTGQTERFLSPEA